MEAHVSGMPFRLDVVETGEQWVVTCTTPHGKAVSRIPAPFSPDALHRALADVEKALIRTYRPVTTRRAAPVDQVVREFGETLSDAVLAGDVRRLFDRCRQDARERQMPLRILLDTDGPNVSVIAWEFTVDPNARDEYLALRVPIVRSPHLIGPVSSSRVALPLRVLGVSARPADLPALDTQREREDISKAFWQRLTPGFGRSSDAVAPLQEGGRVDAAAARLAGVTVTPVQQCERLSLATGWRVFLKREYRQPVRSYELPGAFGLMARLLTATGRIGPELGRVPKSGAQRGTSGARCCSGLVTVFRRHDDPVVRQLVEHDEPVVGRGDFQGGPGAAAHLQFDRSAVAVGHADVLVPQIDPLTHPLNGEPAVGDV